ncbi:MAG: site-2 protease family protein [Gemmatimonadota bacterium]|nr:site-2 protease family protein [Gemmatimonadota bacterium]
MAEGAPATPVARMRATGVWVCERCGTEIAPSLNGCPSCGALVHAAELKRLAAQANEAETAADVPRALGFWREALMLLPPDSLQHATVLARVEELSHRIDAGAQTAEERHVRSKLAGKGAVVVALGLLAWKFKFVLVFLLTKGKLLLLGLTKATTVFSMVLSLGVYWAAWGWRLALGLIGSIYVHEMGHVAALNRYGIKASAPMFIPGVGAFIAAKQPLQSEREEAMVGLMGPVWGLGAALAALGVWRATGEPFYAVIAKVGAWINLFNLIPVWQLDGAHGFRAMSRAHRIVAALAIGAAFAVTREGMLVLLLIAAVATLFGRPARQPDRRAVLLYVGLVAALAVIADIAVPMDAR